MNTINMSFHSYLLGVCLPPFVCFGAPVPRMIPGAHMRLSINMLLINKSQLGFRDLNPAQQTLTCPAN